MSSHEERTKNFEKISTDLRNMMSELKAHYPDHIIKVVLGDYPSCSYCQGLISRGLVVQDEGKMVRGLSCTAQSFGNETYVLVPKSWLGKKVTISLTE